MEQVVVETRIRSLAQPLWESAARPYGLTLDCWLMAEQMVLEMMSFATRVQAQSLEPTSPLPLFTELPSEVPLERIRALAECMWGSAGRQYGVAQDFWLAAEKHILAMMRAATVLQGSDSANACIAELVTLPPDKYLERIRVLAFELWQTAGRSYGNAFQYWLEAERLTLEMMGQIADGGTIPVVNASTMPDAASPADSTVPAASPERPQPRSTAPAGGAKPVSRR
jgi:hypothetical protein